MKIFKKILTFIVAIILPLGGLLANSPPDFLSELVLTGDIYGRSSRDFRKKANNKEFVIPEGSEGTVLETRRLQSDGSYAIKIRITKVASGKEGNPPPVGAETWVYYSQTEPWMTLKDKLGEEVQDPEVALTTLATKDNETYLSKKSPTRLDLPTKADVLRSQKMDYIDNVTYDPLTPKEICPVLKSETQLSRLKTDFEDVAKATTNQTESPEASESKWAGFPKIMDYSEGNQVQQAISYGMRNKHKRSTKFCYRYVKRAMLASDLVSDYPPGAMAKHAVSDLKRRGFINMMEDPRYKDLVKSPQDAPKGAILVYKNTAKPRAPGHVEIKTDWGHKGGYVSDFYRSTSQSLSSRQLIGVMLKEDL